MPQDIFLDDGQTKLPRLLEAHEAGARLCTKASFSRQAAEDGLIQKWCASAAEHGHRLKSNR
jgi:hypothetical protein